MKLLKLFLTCTIVLIFLGFPAALYSSNPIAANNPYIQYFGRWDFSDSTAPTHSWPGVYIYAEFEGTSIGISTNDNWSYYNVFIDDTISSVFHGTVGGVASYTLASGLADGHHTILFTLRNETNWTEFSFNGFILDDGKNLLLPIDKPDKKIEFIGDSYTCASGNLWKDNTAAPAGDYTNEYQGFPSITARNYGAQYMVTGRGGYGLVLDYLGNYGNSLPNLFDRTLVYTPQPKWDFTKWNPNLVVICLGLNDYNGWNGYNVPISSTNAAIYRQTYHSFISTIMDVYPFAKILAVAPNGITWLEQQISQVVSEENARGHTNVFYTYFPSYSSDFVNAGHPDVKAHFEIAGNLIATIDTFDAWTPFKDLIPPRIVTLPDTPLVATSASFSVTVKTDKYATVRYSAQDKPYDQMENQFTVTGTRIHSVTLACQQGQSYLYYVRAKDAYGNTTDSSSIIKFTTDTTKVFLAWNASVSYDLSSWKLGKAPLGNDSAASDSTKLSPAATVYFRQVITLTNAGSIGDFRVFVEGHDGAVAYVNGKEIGRVNMDPTQDITYNMFALQPMILKTSIVVNTQDLSSTLHNGTNVVAVEVHSRNTANPDVAFDAQIVDKNGTVFYDLGQQWYYYDSGAVPPKQLVDKAATGIFAQGQPIFPTREYLYQNYPNPFNPSTNISFNLTKRTFVKLRIFNVLGQLVESLIGGELEAGNHTYVFHGENRASGVYFYQLTAGTFVDIKKMMMVR
jgi:Carbohydrate esterase 2 N-terminal/GDSL-like Lipase/Acylhydrolase family/Secretion system C-terminal sorting domain